MESLIQQKNGAQSAPATQRVITRQMAFAPPQTTQAMIPPTTFSNNASTINHSFPNSKFRVLRITLCFGFEKFVVNRMVIVSCWWKMSRVAVGLCAPLIWSGRSTVGPVPLKHQTMDRHHPRLPRGLNAAGKGLAFAEHWFYLAVPEAHAQRGRSRQPSWKVRIQAQKGKESLL